MNFKDFLFQYKIGEDVYREEVKAKSFVVGRSSRCDVKIDCEIISRKHIQIFFEKESIKIKDLGSTNGTFLNGKKLKPHKKFEYETGSEFFVKGAGLRCDFEIKNLSQQQDKSHSPDHELEISEVSFPESESGMESPQPDREFSAKDGDDFSGDDNFMEMEMEMDIPSHGNVNKSDSISIFRRGHSEEPSDPSLGKNIKDQGLEDPSPLLESEISELKELVVKGERDIQKRKSEIKNLKDEIIQRQKDLEENQIRNRQSEEELNKLHSKLLEAEGSIHFINKIKQEGSQETDEQVISSQIQDENVRLEKNKELWENGLKENPETGMDEGKEDKEPLDSEFGDLKIKAGLEAKQEAAVLIKEARREAEKTIQEAEKRAESKVEKAEKLAEKIVNQAQEQIENDFTAHQQELKKMKEEANIEIEGLYSEVKRDRKQLEQDLEEMHQEAKRDVDLKLKGLRVELETEMEERTANRLKEIEEKAADRMKKIDVKAENRIQEAQREAEKTIREAEEKADNKVKVAEKQALEVVSQARQKMDDLARYEKDIEKQKMEMDGEIKDFQSRMETDRKKLERELEKMKQEAGKKAVLESDKLRFELETKIKVEMDKKLEEAEKQAREIIVQAHQQADNHISASEMEIDKKRKDADEEIQNLRSRTVKKFQDQRRFMEEEENKRNQLKAARLQKELSEVLRVRIRPYLRDDVHLAKVSSMINKSVDVIALGKMDDSFIEDEHGVDPGLHRKKAKNFWLLSGLSFVTVVVLLVFLPTFREVALQTGRDIAAEEDKKTRKKIVDAKVRNDLSKEFQPDKVDKFLETYTDCVLYTRDYVAIELFKEYRQKWILELQNYFTEKLKLSENHLVPFIAQESNLIRELDEAMKKINGHFVDEGIARMREIEKGFERKLRDQLGRKGNYKKVMAFKKAFFEKNADKFREKISSQTP